MHTRPRTAAMIVALCTATALALAACTDENDLYVPDNDGAADASSADGSSVPGDTGPGSPDLNVVDGGVPLADGGSCTPNAFMACKTASSMLRCNPSGNGTVIIDCAPFKCDATIKRCTECDPASAPYCQNDVLVTCTANGLLVKTTCPDGCKNGKCSTCTPQLFYKDADGDGWGNPGASIKACSKPAGHVSTSGDCDDLDAAVHPQQKKYFDAPSKGTATFDYNCNTVVELQHAALAKCTWKGNNCVGDGWSQTVPQCGKTGTFINCVKKGGRGTSCSQSVVQLIQACR